MMIRMPVTLSEGQHLDPRKIGPVTQTDIVRFAGAGGDFNPLHHDADYARAAGLPGGAARRAGRHADRVGGDPGAARWWARQGLNL